MIIPTVIGLAIAVTANNAPAKAGGLAIAVICRAMAGG
jgi:hypothetical protein